MKSKSHLRFYTHLLLTSALMLGGGLSISELALAAGTPAGTTITNTATGSFEGETSGSTGTVTSNTVTISVSEVAGITAVASGNQEAPASVANAGAYQGVAGINTGDVVYFDFTITNVGNDPTAFFIPGTATISGGTLENIQIIAVDPDGAGAIAPKTLADNVPNTGVSTITVLGSTDGYIPINGTVTVRVAVKVMETVVGNAIAVTLGDTSTSPGSQNQPYIANGLRDLYSVDLADGTPNPYPVATFPSVSQVLEANGIPANGDTINRRQEASATQSLNLAAIPVISGYKSVTLTADPDNSVTPSAGDTLTWRVTYANTGTVDVTNFQITDVLDLDVSLARPLAVGDVTVNATQGIAPAPNTGYTGAGNNNLFASSFTLKAGGVVTIDFPVKIGAGAATGQILQNQSTATSNELPAAGIKTDNIDNTTTGLPTDVTPLPSSLAQTQTAAISPTTVTIIAPSAANPKLLLAKRITAVNGVPIAGFTNDGIALSPDDDPNWPTPLSDYLRGAVTSNNISVKPNDQLEYTIYFLVSGNKDLTNITICDLIPPNTTFVTGAYNAVGGGSNLDIAFANNATTAPTSPTSYLTSLFDGDRGQFYPAGSVPPTTCRKANTTPPAGTLSASDNTDGLVVVNVVTSPTTLPHATAVGFPTASYGFIRFQVKVK